MYRYFGKGSHMSAVLKQDMHRIRTLHPKRYVQKKAEVSEMDGTGKVSVVSVVYESAAMPMSGYQRHKLSWQRDRF